MPRKPQPNLYDFEEWLAKLNKRANGDELLTWAVAVIQNQQSSVNVKELALSSSTGRIAELEAELHKARYALQLVGWSYLADDEIVFVRNQVAIAKRECFGKYMPSTRLSAEQAVVKDIATRDHVAHEGIGITHTPVDGDFHVGSTE